MALLSLIDKQRRAKVREAVSRGESPFRKRPEPASIQQDDTVIELRAEDVEFIPYSPPAASTVPPLTKKQPILLPPSLRMPLEPILMPDDLLVEPPGLLAKEAKEYEKSCRATQLVCAVISGDLEAVMNAHSKGADLNTDLSEFHFENEPEKSSRSALELARRLGYKGIADYLRMNGARE